MNEQQKTASYKAVPDEPTAEMREAGHRAAWQSVPSLFDMDDVANVYRAMLAAAPAARLEDQPPPADVAMLASHAPATPAADDSGNTLLRVGEDEPMPEISAATAKQIANDAINLPDAVAIEMANQAEQAYQVLSEALGLTPEQMSELTLADVEAIAAELITQRERASSQTELLSKICHTLDLSLYSTAAEILSEVENISRLTDRAIQTGARDATQGPYTIISDPHVAQFIDFLVTLVGKAEAATREECAELRGHPDVLAPIGNSAWGEAYQDGWIAGTAAYRDAICAMNEKGTA